MENKQKPQNADLLRKILKQIQTNVGAALQLLEDGGASHARIASLVTAADPRADMSGAKTIEGAFDGQKMVGEDGQTYLVPPNYASKSKLVVGDRMKLVITVGGNFIFKQIGPVERDRVVCRLALDPVSKQYVVTAGERQWKVLTASVTYYRGEPGDEVVALLPKGQETSWAAVENVVKK